MRKSAVTSALRLLGVVAALWLLWLALLLLFPAWIRALNLPRDSPTWLLDDIISPFTMTIAGAALLALLCLPVALGVLRKKSLRPVARALLFSMTPICLVLGCLDMVVPGGMGMSVLTAVVTFHVITLVFLSQLPDLVLSGEYPLCAECGYDLRGSPTNRCSECGVGSYAADEAAKALLDRMVGDGGRVRIEFYDDGRYVVSMRCNGKRHTVSGTDLQTVAGALAERRQFAHDLAGR